MRNWRFKESDFNDFPVYEGHDLGVQWTRERTIVKIWAPSALRIFFRLYQSPQEGNPIKEFQLLPDESGNWIYEIRENLEGFFYTFQVRDRFGWLKEGPDIYARATGGKRDSRGDHRSTKEQSPFVGIGPSPYIGESHRDGYL